MEQVIRRKSPGYKKKRREITNYILYSVLEKFTGKKHKTIKAYFNGKKWDIANLDKFAEYLHKFKPKPKKIESDEDVLDLEI